MKPAGPIEQALTKVNDVATVVTLAGLGTLGVEAILQGVGEPVSRTLVHASIGAWDCGAAVLFSGMAARLGLRRWREAATGEDRFCAAAMLAVPVPSILMLSDLVAGRQMGSDAELALAGAALITGAATLLANAAGTVVRGVRRGTWAIG